MTTTLIPFFLPALVAASRAAEWARRAVLDTLQRRQARARYRSLCALDDTALRDLGIDRSELHAIALHPTDPDRVWRRA